LTRDHDHDDEGHEHGSPHHFFNNWDTYEGPFAKKLALSLRNLTIGRAKHGTCCGHYGEPGC
jgi:hypothetical protein